MIEILGVRDLNDNEIKKLKLEQEKEELLHKLEEKQHEIDSINNNEQVTLTKENKDKNKIGELTPEEEIRVSKAISKDNNKEVLTDEKIEEIREKALKEYANIKPDVKLSYIPVLIFVVIAVVLTITLKFIPKTPKIDMDKVNQESNEPIIIEDNVDMSIGDN